MLGDVSTNLSSLSMISRNFFLYHFWFSRDKSLCIVLVTFLSLCYNSVNQGNWEKKGFAWTIGFRGVSSSWQGNMTMNGRQGDRNMKLKVEIYKCKKKAWIDNGMSQVTYFLQQSSICQIFYNVPKEHSQLGTRCWNIRIYRGISQSRSHIYDLLLEQFSDVLFLTLLCFIYTSLCPEECQLCLQYESLTQLTTL